MTRAWLLSVCCAVWLHESLAFSPAPCRSAALTRSVPHDQAVPSLGRLAVRSTALSAKKKAKGGKKKGGGSKQKQSGFEWASNFEVKPTESNTMRSIAEVSNDAVT